MTAWTWTLTAIGVTSLIAIGNRRWWGFLIAFANECLYLTFSIKYHLWGFTAAAVIYGTLNLHNANKWRTNDLRPGASRPRNTGSATHH